MKKYALLFLSLALVISCDKKSTDPVAPPVDPTVPVETTLSAYKTDGGIWSETDEIIVHSAKGSTAKFTVASTNGLSAASDTAKFVGMTTPEGPWYAASPASAECKSDTAIEFAIPDTQEIAAGAKPANFYVAAWAEGTKVAFSPVLATVTLNLLGAGDVKSLTIQDMAEKPLLFGKAVVEIKDWKIDQISFSSEAEEGTAALKVELSEAVKLDAANAQKVSIAVPADSFKDGIIVSAYAADKSLVKTLILPGNYAASLAAPVEINVDFASSPYSGGLGTQESPFFITSAADLLKMAELSNDKDNKVANEKYVKGYYKMLNDIDMKGVEFTNISFDYSDDDYSFSGEFDGCEHTISNIEPKPVNNGPVGLFGYICGGTVKNLTISGASVTGVNKVGAIAGSGWNGAKVINCHVVNSTISGPDGMSGGIVGYLVGSTAEDCSVESSVITCNDGNNAGGLIGYIKNEASVRNCRVVKCDVSCQMNMGGVVGTAEGSMVEECSCTGNTVVASLGKDSAGGIVGYLTNSTAKGCEAEDVVVKITGDSSAGGIAGYVSGGKSAVEGCTVTGCDISCKMYCGGIVGSSKAGIYRDCVVKGATVILSSEDSAGGIAGGGNKIDVSFDGCFVESGTKIKGSFYVGGVIGFIKPDAGCIAVIKNCGLEDSYVLSVTDDGGGEGDACNGGMLGWLNNTESGSGLKILNCYCYPAESGFAIDNASRKPGVAGIAGYLRQSGACGNIELAGNCTDVARTDMVFGGAVFKQGQDLVSDDHVAAIYGYAGDYSTVSFKNNYWVGDTGMNLIGMERSEAVYADNESFTTAVFEDGTTVLAKLNAFASSYQGESLSPWTISNKRPVIVR